MPIHSLTATIALHFRITGVVLVALAAAPGNIAAVVEMIGP
jgi:hypothetical protein